MNNTLHYAQRYAELGWKVFPVSENSKIPLKDSKGFKEATNDPDAVDRMFSSNNCNIGISAEASGLLVVDIDPRNGGDDSYRELIAAYGELPDTVTALTPSGGTHYFFKLPKDLTKATDSLADGIDIKVNGYVVVAPSKISVNGTTKNYDWFAGQSPFEFQIAEAPSWLIEKIKTAEPKRFELPEIVHEKKRNDTLLRYACSLYSRNELTLGQVSAAVKTYNQECCKPPLEEKEVETIVKSASSYNEQPKIETREEKTLSLKEFLALDIPPIEYHLTGILPKCGKAMISGNSNAGKSIFVQNIALAISRGEVFLTNFESAQTKVLYLDLEMGKSALKERFTTMAGNEIPENLFVRYEPSINLLDKEDQERLKIWIQEVKADVVIIDPLANAWQGDEKDQVSVAQMVAFFNQIISDLKVSVLLVHHWRKATKDFKSGGQMMAGSYRWEAWLDHHITLEGQPQSVTISCHKARNMGRFQPFLAKINTDTLKFEYITSYERKFTEETLQSIYEEIGGGKVSIPDLIKYAKDKKICSETTIRKILDETNLFEINKEGKTHYISITKPRELFIDDPEEEN